MKSVTVEKPKAKARKRNIPLDIQAAIKESLSGHEKLYDAISELIAETYDKTRYCPGAAYAGHAMRKDVEKLMRQTFFMGIERSKQRHLKEALDRIHKQSKKKKAHKPK